jgi:hypothetical protein
MLSKQISKERSMKAENQLNFDHNLKLTKCGGIALLIMPLCYVCMFVIYGVILAIPQTDILSDKIAYIISNQGIISMANICGYLIFGGLLLIAVQAIHNRLAINKSHLLNSASAFGFIWVILMMCSGMTALVGLNTMAALYSKGAEHAETLFIVYTTMVNALGGGVELVGGMWVLLLSICGLRNSMLSKALCVFGVIVGLLGILTVYQGIPELKDAFGLSQIIWFIWLGIAMLSMTNPMQTAE